MIFAGSMVGKGKKALVDVVFGFAARLESKMKDDESGFIVD